ncbi:ankyrin repeat domain-containing protein [Spirosoma sp. BT702]|uniref:Ankyrin repeat domain-containing protein n=1 Tax=Spirosoma profusum TaxID=2771354 RepID=A0A926XV64_9BACT|nr:ankyrin repeat domain-containing protein [Spirosoma profusum]MBD2701179.1 ankyrin repeat domain-containing protein [Spirosoma profusum]
MTLRNLIANKELGAIQQALEQNPELANEGIPYDDQNTANAHPLHRICDGVMSGTYSDEEAVEMAKIFLKYGANVNGDEQVDNRDTPLVAAASLHAEKVGILYIEKGAAINHPGCYGGIPLHWAAWTGRDKLVQRLIEAGAEINRRCIEFDSTPLLWAVHGFKFGGPENRHNQIECVRLLLAAGADKNTPNKEGTLPIRFLNEQDVELRQLLS